jgi:hypothetical protein
MQALFPGARRGCIDRKIMTPLTAEDMSVAGESVTH